MPELFVAHVPVIHDGYLRAFDRHPQSGIAVLDGTVLAQFDYLRKDIRSLTPERAAEALNGLGYMARTVGSRALVEVFAQNKIIMPDDDISHTLAASHTDSAIEFEPIFLRWDRRNVAVDIPVLPDRFEAVNSTHDEIVRRLHDESRKSSNWWRRVAAVAVDGDGILSSAHNSSMPTPHSSWIDSDPRITARRGEAIESSIDIHAEARLIAEAAKNGTRLAGKSIYVSTFPCPNCAKLIAEAGFHHCYFIDGYATLDGQDTLKSYGVEIIKLEVEQPFDTDPVESFKPYPQSN